MRFSPFSPPLSLSLPSSPSYVGVHVVAPWWISPKPWPDSDVCRAGYLHPCSSGLRRNPNLMMQLGGFRLNPGPGGGCGPAPVLRLAVAPSGKLA